MAKGLSLHVGVNTVNPAHYTNNMPSLTGCENDAESMRLIAKSRNFTNMKLVGTQATRNAVIMVINRASEVLENGDTFFLTFSGHGGWIRDFNSDEEDSRDETWCLYDGQLIDDELEQMWLKFKSGVRILVVSDSCNSGTVAKFMATAVSPKVGKAGGVKRMPPNLGDVVYEKNKEFYREIVFKLNTTMMANSSTPTQYSGLLLSAAQDNQDALDGYPNSAFTTQLLKVWNNGSFNGNYINFYTQIRSGVTVHTPNYYRFGRNDPQFEALSPFTF